jgi:methylated-DNA-[protein]-cysteine S-methyltransferase
MTGFSARKLAASGCAGDEMSTEQLTWTTYESPIGRLTLVAGPAGIRSLRFPSHSARLAQAAQRRMPAVAEQLASYFAGELHGFELELDLRGTPLQQQVWERLLQIPYGTTTSYGELAQRIDESLYPTDLEQYKRARLVRAAVGRTPTPILVPCHRVIGADGSLTGYGGGLPRKRALLELEGGCTAGKAVEPDRSQRQLALS